MRLTLPILVVLWLLALLAPCADAEEIFVLDNGEVLRGWVIRENDDGLFVQLTGFTQEARIQIPRARIVNRFVRVEATERHSVSEPISVAVTEDSVAAETPLSNRWVNDLPAEEPAAADEGFFHRLARRAVLSVPPEPGSRALLAGLVFVALLALIAMGGKLAEIDTMSLARMTTLSSLLGAFLVLDVFLHEHVLRADRAIWILPLQCVVWLGSAAVLLRCGIGRTVLLFAFVLFCTAMSVFAAGAILVSF